MSNDHEGNMSLKFFMNSITRIVRMLLAVTVLISCNSKKVPVAGGARRQQGPLMVDGYVISSSSISEKIEVPGSLLPFEETEIRAEVGGRIVELNIQEGSTATKGTYAGEII